MEVAYSEIVGLSILTIDSEIKIVDNELNVYGEFDMDNPFFDPKDVIVDFVRHTISYFESGMLKRFMILALKSFASSEFVKQYREYAKSQE